MDLTDMVIVEELETNSRRPYREIADKLGLSVNAVHKRVQGMMDRGTLHSFITRLGMGIEPPVLATAFGHSTAPDLPATIAGLGRDDHTSQVVVATGNYIYFQWYLHDLGELDDFMAMARSEAKISSPRVVFRTIKPPAGSKGMALSGLDWRLLDQLLNDSRRPVVDLARELDVSTKTVKRRLARMEADGAIIYTTRFVPNASHDMFSFFHTHLRGDLDRREVIAHIMERYKHRLIDATTLDSDPQMVLFSGWTKTMKELKELRAELEMEPSIESLFINIYFDTYYFDTWREDLVRRRAREAARG